MNLPTNKREITITKGQKFTFEPIDFDLIDFEKYLSDYEKSGEISYKNNMDNHAVMEMLKDLEVLNNDPLFGLIIE